jgi:cytochrome c-type biogenesis protein CcmH
MMIFWGTVVALSIIASGVALWPALRANSPEPSEDLRRQALLRRELDDIARDRAQGRIAAPEADAAELEVKRRYLRTDSRKTAARAMRPSRPAPLLGAATLAAALAVALYLVYGRPDLATSDPSAAQAQAAAIAALPPEQRMAQIRAMVDGLEARLLAVAPEAREKDFDGWMRLGVARSQLGEAPAAARAFARAAAIDPKSADAEAMWGLSLATEANAQAKPRDRLPEAALAHLERALTLDPNHAEALWYLGLDAQAGGESAVALKHWRRLLAGLEVGSPDYGMVSSAITALEKGDSGAGSQ